MTKAYTDEEIETYRLEELERQIKDNTEADNEDRKRRFEPKSFGHHEALHTAYVLMETFEHYVLNHPSVVGDPDMYRQCYRTFEQMFETYQIIGRKQE